MESGVLWQWALSRSGGYGKIYAPASKKLFFLHRSDIISGEPLLGSVCRFQPIPAPADKRYPRATKVIIDNTHPRVTALDVLSGRDVRS